MPDEEAFGVLVRLMYSYGLRGHFLPEMPGLQLRMYQVGLLMLQIRHPNDNNSYLVRPFSRGITTSSARALSSSRSEI